MISRAFSPAWTRAFGPIVSRCSWHSTVPSTSPSMVRSSRANSCHLTVTFLPRAAELLRGKLGSGSKALEGVDIVLVISLLCGSAAEVGTPAGLSGLCGSSSCVLLLHMQRISPRKLLHSIVLLQSNEVGSSPSPASGPMGYGHFTSTKAPALDLWDNVRGVQDPRSRSPARES